MEDIDQLLVAHRSVVQLKRSQAAAKKSGSAAFAQAAAALAELARIPGRGRVAEVDAINRAAIVLVAAHLQGYVEDLYELAAKNLLQSRVSSIDALIENALKRFSGNPVPGNIELLFRSIGIDKVLDGIHWQKTSNQSLRNRLDEIVKLRNKIAHGAQEIVYKSKVVSTKKFIALLVENLDEKVGNEIQSITGTPSW